jgi:hypothetical protein
MRREHGFSLLELTIAMGIMLGVTASVFSLMNPAQGAFAAQPEVADMQQRLRVATDTLYKDLVMAGNGAYQGSKSGSLGNYFAAVLPLRAGSVNEDPVGSFFTDRITLIYVPPTVAQTTLADHGPSLNSSEIGVNQEAGCPDVAHDPLCGFKSGMTVMMYDDSGNYDIFTITAVQANALHIQHNSDNLTYTGYDANNTKIVQASNFVYYLKTDDVTKTYQLMYYDGGLGGDVPVVDNVVGLKFDYYGEPQPPQWRPGKAVSDTTGPWTTYGPKPSAIAVAPFAAGANCIFDNDGSPTPAPALAVLGPPASALVKLTATQLTDGPWCPNATSLNRWDADLLRVRKIAVTVRVQAATSALRGPASTLFTHGGTSNGGDKWVPDQEIRFQVSPRNLNLGR